MNKNRKIYYTLGILVIGLMMLVTVGPSVLVTMSQASATLTTATIVPSPVENLQTFNPNPLAAGGGLFANGLALPGMINVVPIIINYSNGEIIPVVVQNWTVSPNVTYVYQAEQKMNATQAEETFFNLTVYLNHNYYWANGQPVTAWDLAAQLFVYFASYGGYTNLYNIEVPNNYTLIITIPYNHVSSISSLAAQYLSVTEWPMVINYNLWKPIVQQIWGNWTALYNASNGLPTNAKVNSSYFIAKISTFNPVQVYGLGAIPASFNGAFYVTQITPSEIILSKNPYYPGVNSIPWNQIIVYQFTTITSLLAALKSGEIDYLIGTIPPQDFSLLPSYYKVLVIPQPSAYMLDFNFKNPWLKIVLVRQALAYVLNRTAIAEAGGMIYSPVSTPYALPNMTPLWIQEFGSFQNQYLNPYPTNWTKAAQLLEEAGFTYKNGQWYTPNGTQFTLQLVGFYLYGPDTQNQLTTIAAELSAFGIKTTYSMVTSSSIAQSEWSSGNGYDLAYSTWFGYGGFYGGSFNWADSLWNTIFGWNVSHTVMTAFVPTNLWVSAFKNVIHSYPSWTASFVVFNTSNSSFVSQYGGIFGEQNIQLFNGQNMTIVSLWSGAAGQNAINNTLGVIEFDEGDLTLNWYLPGLPLVYVYTPFIYNTQTISVPSINSQIWIMSWFGWSDEALVQELLTSNLITPASTTSTTSTTSTSPVTTVTLSTSTTTTVTSTSTATTTATTTVTSTVPTTVSSGMSSTALYAIVAVVIIIIIALIAVFVVRRR